MAKVKAKGKARAGVTKRACRGKKNVDVDTIRESITRMVALAAGDMVKAAIEEAKKGHSTALKYLFEMVGLYPATLETEQAEDREMSMAELFCRELGLPMRPPDPKDEEPAMGEGGQASTAGTHAVE
jgi:positive regulator of sigma E activity